MTKHAEVNKVIDDVLVTLKRNTPAEIDTAAVGDKVWSRLDPNGRAGLLAAYVGRIQCRLMARERCRLLDTQTTKREKEEMAQAETAMADFMNPLLFELKLQETYPTGDGTTWVPRMELNLEERAAFSDALGHELDTKAAHKRAFDAETQDLKARDYFDEKGWPRGSERRVYAEQMALIKADAEATKNQVSDVQP